MTMNYISEQFHDILNNIKSNYYLNINRQKLK